MNEMENLKVEFAEFKKDLEYVKKDISEIKDTIKELLKVVNNSIPALRNDVNLANQISQENKIAITKLESRIEVLENDKTSRDTLISALKWILGFLGVSNIGTIIYLLINAISQGNK